MADHPALERCDDCNLIRVYCQGVREMERQPCCPACSH